MKVKSIANRRKEVPRTTLAGALPYWNDERLFSIFRRIRREPLAIYF